MVSDDARDMLSCKLTLNLNEPCKIEDTSGFILPSTAGVWWNMIVGTKTWSYTNDLPSAFGVTDYSKCKPNGTHGATNEEVKRYIDFAAKERFAGGIGRRLERRLKTGSVIRSSMSSIL